MEKHTEGSHSFADIEAISQAIREHEILDNRFDLAKAEIGYLRAQAHTLTVVDLGFSGSKARGLDVQKKTVILHDGTNIPMEGELRELADVIEGKVDAAKLLDKGVDVAKEVMWEAIYSGLNLETGKNWTISLQDSTVYIEEGGQDGGLAEMMARFMG